MSDTPNVDFMTRVMSDPASPKTWPEHLAELRECLPFLVMYTDEEVALLARTMLYSVVSAITDATPPLFMPRS